MTSAPSLQPRSSGNDSLTPSPPSATEQWRHVCLNCGAAISGAFCGQCGQRAVPPYPTTGELAGDAFHEVSGWDGRFAVTMRTLINAPGKLTKEFLEGRRVRYISPIRLYLVASLAYFVVAASTPNVRPTGTLVAVGGIRFGVFSTPDSVSARPGSAARAAQDVEAARTGGLGAARRDSALAVVGRAPALIRPILRRAIADPNGFQRGLVTNMPRVLFAILPVFAAILALFYRGRHYPEHLYFALHLHAFVFLALILNEVVKLPDLDLLEIVVGIGVLVWIVGYALTALRRVYGGTWPATIVKSVGVGALYVIAGVPALFGLVMWTALRG
jgi:hypothetical protein